ncbi:MAG: hypothetical protein QM730_25165 [Anaerolineales bacterium]
MYSLHWQSVVIIAVLFLVLGAGGKSSSSSSSDKKKSSGGGKPQASSTSTSSSSHRSNYPRGVGDVAIFGSGGTRTREVVREVEKKVEVPVAPRSIDCLYCKRSYVPAENHYACPACGAATPKEQIEESEAPREGSEN